MKHTFRYVSWLMIGACALLLLLIFGNSGVRMQMSASEVSFADVLPEHQEAEAIEFLRKSNVLSGYGDGNYHPNAVVNRAEWAKVLVIGTGNQPNAERYANCFPDVTTEWFSPFVCFGLAQGYWKGRPDGHFYPSDPVTIAEALKMVELVFDFDVKTAEGSAWYVPYRDAAKELHVIYDDEAAHVDQFLTRAVMARLLLRTGLSRISGQAFDDRFLRFLEKEGKTFADVLADPGLQHSIAWEDNPKIRKEGWILRIEPEGSASTFRMFRLHYSHRPEPFLAYEGVTPETYILPTIHIESQSGIAHLGLDGDASWEGTATPATQYTEVDADTSGINKNSMNLQYDVRKRIVTITSAAGLRRGTFNLKTGAIAGDPEITKNERSLHAWFASHRNEPFTVCVSDAQGFEGEIGIFADFRTVGIRPCARPDFQSSPIDLILYPPSAIPIFAPVIGGHGPNPPPGGGGGIGGTPPPLIGVIGGGMGGGGHGGGNGGGTGGGGSLVGLPGGKKEGVGGGDPR
ncbi:MAG TPA: S-layer homology domain-containing protein, partial [Candidatus Peribacteraceae bacterium]|nr:S-layer homology domain-containing protein [Candidatus Peribacteraceae bacterium]